LAWSPLKGGLLLSGAYDKKICLWDLAIGSGASVLDAQHVFEVMPHWPMLFPFFSFCVVHHHNWSLFEACANTLGTR
jgi:WD40 repeat protein